MTIKEFTQKCRELQGAYRERMGEPMGVGPWPPENKKSRPQINMLVDGGLLVRYDYNKLLRHL